MENGNARVNLDSQFFRRIIADHQQPFSVYAPDPEELSNDILEKLEQAGRVPSKDKFRRMACNVSIKSIYFKLTFYRLLYTLVHVHTTIDVSDSLVLIL